MWMTDFVREVKRQLRDVYGLAPTRVTDGEPCFDDVPDGYYPMFIQGTVEHVCVIDQKFYFLKQMAPKGSKP